MEPAVRIKTVALRDGLSLPVFTTEPHPCAYLPGRLARETLAVTPVDGDTYQRLMDNGFRRSERYFYRPACADCDACRPLRVPVDRFRPSRSQRRALRRNLDVQVRCAAPQFSEARWELFQRYQAAVHDRPMLRCADEYRAVFCRSPLPTIEMTYTLGERLIGLGVVDACRDSLSSVYFYYDPEEARRSLGVFSALREIEECRRRRRPYWYLGFYVDGCAKMAYKAAFRPCELLDATGIWRPFPESVS